MHSRRGQAAAIPGTHIPCPLTADKPVEGIASEDDIDRVHGTVAAIPTNSRSQARTPYFGPKSVDEPA
jgi:hypothetical protein